MSIFESFVGFFLNIAWAVVQIICGLAILAIVYYVLWFVISMIWEIIHESSYKLFIRKVKSVWRKVVNKTKNIRGHS